MGHESIAKHFTIAAGNHAVPCTQTDERTFGQTLDLGTQQHEIVDNNARATNDKYVSVLQGTSDPRLLKRVWRNYIHDFVQQIC